MLSRSVSFYRYLVQGELPRDFLTWVDTRLRQHVFLTIDDTPEESSAGWVELDNLLETEFVPGRSHKGEYVAFTLRLDTRKVPGAVLRKHYLMAAAQVQQKQSRPLSRQQRLELKKTVQQELLRRQLPQPSLYDVVWQPARGRLWLFATSPKVRELFETLFQETFSLELYLIFPYTLAQHLIGPEVALDTLTPDNLAPVGEMAAL